MSSPDTNEAVWKDEANIKRWAAEAAGREAKRAEPMRIMAALLPFEDDEEFTIVDLAAGTGMAARAIMDRYPKAHAVLADYSPAMMDEGSKALAAYEGRYRYVEFDLLQSRWPDGIPLLMDSAVTSQAVHHLPDERKDSLFREVFERLRPGGWYVNYEPVKGPNLPVEYTWQRLNDRFDAGLVYKRTHRGPQEEAQHENHVRYMVDLDRQMSFFRAAGYEAVDVYWKQLDYVVCAGRKPK
ncbi:MAG TPA: class I SAM-dependent methyltransferase [Chloroflexota bacterium]|jgi:SAM-dependent methyltransferase